MDMRKLVGRNFARLRLAKGFTQELSLLKIQSGAIEGRDKQRASSPILRGSTLIAMMQAADLREGNNVIACAG
jgi:hypothetical protein